MVKITVQTIESGKKKVESKIIFYINYCISYILEKSLISLCVSSKLSQIQTITEARILEKCLSCCQNTFILSVMLILIVLIPQLINKQQEPERKTKNLHTPLQDFSHQRWPIIVVITVEFLVTATSV